MSKDNEIVIEDIDTDEEEKLVSEDNSESKISYFKLLGVNFSKSLRGLLWFFLLFVYEESVFHIWAFGKVTPYFALKVLFCLPTALFFSVFSSYFKELANKIINWVLSVFVLLFYFVHILYHSIFKVFFSIEFVDKNNAKIFSYYREIIQGIKDNWIVLLFSFVLPLIVYVLSDVFKLIKYNRVSVKFIYINLVYLLISAGILVPVVLVFGKDDFSPYELLVKENSSEYSFDRLGVTITNEIQVRNLIIPREIEVTDEDFDVWVFEEPVVDISDVSNDDTTAVSDNEIDETDTEIIEEIVETIDTSPNILNIDFLSIAENTTNEDVINLSKYFASIEPTYRNEYTGMFKGYNLIFMTCEAFSPMAVDEIHTPTLYRLTHEGFVFNNFYNPRTGGSTSDGEFVVTTSLVPTNGGAKNYKIVGQNAMPFSVGNIFNRTYGITSRAYHDNDYEYYGRDISYPAMGYYYQGVGNGVVVGKHWPQSDLEMMQFSIPEYIDDELFNIYYMTVSGHMNYSWTGNYCANIHKEEVQDLPYSEACKAYIACQMELDKALEYLINQLEEKGIADRTVICFTGDHWPYGLTNDQISEILGHTVEENFELYKSNLVLWSESITEPIYIDKYCDSIDIVPTLLNLFGFEYDSRLYMGRDILSNEEGFVGFLNRSWITDKVMYNAKTGEYIPLTDEELSEDYLKACKKYYNQKCNYSSLIMSTDYYQYVADQLGIEVKDAEQNYVPDYSKFTP